MAKYLRNKKDGFIYRWHPILAAHPLCEEVTEEQAFPARFVKPELVQKMAQAYEAKGAKPVDLATDDIIDELTRFASPEIEADASRGLPE